MKIKIKQMIDSLNAFSELQALKLPPKVALEVYRLGKELEKELEAWKTMTQNLYKQYNVPVENGHYKLKGLEPEIWRELSKELDELLDADIELKEFHIPFTLFEEYNISVSPHMLAALDWLILDEEIKRKEATTL